MREGRGKRCGAIAASGALAAGVLAVSPAAEAVPDGRPPGVKLLMDITAAGDAAHGPGYTLTYTVRVRARGGVARHAALRLTAERPLVWTSSSKGCSKADSGRELRCELGDVGAKPQERRGTVRIPASKLSGPAAKPLGILAVADASNASRRSALAMFDFSGAVPPSPAAKPKPKPCAGKSCPASGAEPSPRGKPQHCAGGKAKAGAKPCTKSKPPAGKPSASGPRPRTSIRPSGGKPTPRKTTPKVRPGGGGKVTGRPSGVTTPRPHKSVRPSGGKASSHTPPQKPSHTSSHASPHRPSQHRPPSHRPSHTPSHRTPRVHAGAGDAEHPSRPAGGQTNAGGLPAVPEAPRASAPAPACRGADCLGDAPADVEAGEPGVPDPEAAEPPEPAPDVAAPAPSGADVPPVPQPDPNVFPQMSPPPDPNVAAGKTRMTLMSPTGAKEGDDTDWAVVVGAALVAEIGLLWGAACVALWRRRIRLNRATAVAADADGTV